jgi:hypothetical protein
MGREVLRSPLVSAGLGVANTNKLDARLLKSEDLGTNRAQAAKADKGKLEAVAGSHCMYVRVCVFVYIQQESPIWVRMRGWRMMGSDGGELNERKEEMKMK